MLDTATGRPAAGLNLWLERECDGAFVEVARGTTNEDGRVADLLSPGQLEVGIWRMSFDTGGWFEAAGTTAFYPIVRIVFEVTAPSEHHHVPLLLSPYGYSTYRGS